MNYYQKPLDQVMADFIGTREPDEALLRKMSVITYVDPGDPPVLIFQGDADPFVSVEQAKKLDSLLTKDNVPHELVIVAGGGHGWGGELKDKTDRQTMAFFDRELKKIK